MVSFSERIGVGSPAANTELVEDVPNYVRHALRDKAIAAVTYIDRDSRYSTDLPVGIKEFIEEISYIRQQDPPQDYADSWHCGDILYAQLAELDWNEYYDALEWLAKCVLKFQPRIPTEVKHFEEFRAKTNQVLQRVRSAWHLSETAEFERKRSTEMTEIESQAFKSSAPFAAVVDHLTKARKYLDVRPCDAANSIKESVSAVESRGKIAFAKTATLGDVVAELRRLPSVPGGLATVLDKFYTFANQEPAVRHGGRDPERVTTREAELAYGIALAFTTYLGKVSHEKSTGVIDGDLPAGNG